MHAIKAKQKKMIGRITKCTRGNDVLERYVSPYAVRIGGVQHHLSRPFGNSMVLILSQQ